MRALLFLNPPHSPVNEKKMSDQRREEEDGAPVYTLCCMSVVTLTHTHTHILLYPSEVFGSPHSEMPQRLAAFLS